MVRVNRCVPIAVLLSASLSLAACGSSSGGGFDPTDLISGDLFSNKTPLSGDRKAVFPEGVPGVADGVPKELVKGSAESTVDQVAISEPPAAAARPAQPARSQPSRPAPRPQTASKPAAPRAAAAAPPAAQPPVSQPTRTAAQPAPAASSPAWPDPNTSRQQPQRPAQGNAPAADWPEPNGGQANWPPPDPNTFSR